MTTYWIIKLESEVISYVSCTPDGVIPVTGWSTGSSSGDLTLSVGDGVCFYDPTSTKEEFKFPTSSPLGGTGDSAGVWHQIPATTSQPAWHFIESGTNGNTYDFNFKPYLGQDPSGKIRVRR